MAIFNVSPGGASSSSTIEYSITLAKTDWAINDTELIITYDNNNIDPSSIVSCLPNTTDSDILSEYSNIQIEIFNGGLTFKSPMKKVNDIPVTIQVTSSTQG